MFVRQEAVAARWCVVVVLLAHVATWTIYGTLALAGGIHEDMAEAWAWGKEFQLGYYKHPPLFAWAAGLWFHVLPRADWAFQLLSALNGALGLLGVWAVAGQLVDRGGRDQALLIAILTPLYGPLALKFNANAVLLSLWPFAAYFLIRSLTRQTLRDAVGLGVFAGLAVLGKYYSLLLLVSLLGAAIMHPSASRWWRSPAPLVAVCAGAAVLAPHMAWLIRHDFQTFAYVASKFRFDPTELITWVAVTATAPLLFFAPAVLVLRFVSGSGLGSSLVAGLQSIQTRERRWLLPLALGPFLMTLAFGARAKVSLAYTFPIFFILPSLIVMSAPQLARSKVRTRLTAVAMMVMATMVLVSPVIGLLRRQLDVRGAVEPRREVAEELTGLWWKHYHRPLRYVAGTMAYAGSTPFYSSDAPSHFIFLNEEISPWTSGKIEKDGLLVVCVSDDQKCFEQLARYARKPDETLSWTAQRKAHGHTGPAVDLSIFLFAPAGLP